MKTVSDLMLSDYASVHGLSVILGRIGHTEANARHLMRNCLTGFYSSQAIDKLLHSHKLIAQQSTKNFSFTNVPAENSPIKNEIDQDSSWESIGDIAERVVEKLRK